MLWWILAASFQRATTNYSPLPLVRAVAQEIARNQLL
jgi:hypothetical protein